LCTVVIAGSTLFFFSFLIARLPVKDVSDGAKIHLAGAAQTHFGSCSESFRLMCVMLGS